MYRFTGELTKLFFIINETIIVNEREIHVYSYHCVVKVRKQKVHTISVPIFRSIYRGGIKSVYNLSYFQL